MKSLIIGLCLLVTGCAGNVRAQERGGSNPADYAASTYISWPVGQRTAYVGGFVAGLTTVLRLQGRDIRLRKGKTISLNGLERVITRYVNDNPGQRSLGMGTITIIKLAEYIVLTDKTGVPVQKKGQAQTDDDRLMEKFDRYLRTGEK